MQTVSAGEGMRVGGSRKAILPPELVRCSYNNVTTYGIHCIWTSWHMHLHLVGLQRKATAPEAARQHVCLHKALMRAAY